MNCLLLSVGLPKSFSIQVFFVVCKGEGGLLCCCYAVLYRCLLFVVVHIQCLPFMWSLIPFNLGRYWDFQLWLRVTTSAWINAVVDVICVVTAAANVAVMIEGGD